MGVLFTFEYGLTTLDSGIFVFKLHECKLSRSEAQIEVLMDDDLFPSYASPKIRGRSAKIEESEYSDQAGETVLTRDSRRGVCARNAILPGHSAGCLGEQS